MAHQNLMPIASQPINRISSGQLPSELAELSEEALSQQDDASNNSSSSVVASIARNTCLCLCSYDGDDAE